MPQESGGRARREGGKFLIRRPSVRRFFLSQLPALLIAETQAGRTRTGAAGCHVRLLQNSKSELVLKLQVISLVNIVLVNGLG